MPHGHKIKWEIILCAVIILIGLAIRIHDIEYNFWRDEISSIKIATQQFSDVISSSLEDRPHPPLHNIMLHFWIKAFGRSEVSARSLSVLLSGIFLLVAFMFFRRFVGNRLSLVLLSILSFSPFFVYYGQEARLYALIACLAAVNLLFFVRAFEKPDDRRRLILYGLSCAFLLYSQYLAMLLIATQLVFALCYLREGRFKVIAYGIAGSILILPWLTLAISGPILKGMDPLSYINWIGKPSPSDFAWFYISIFGENPWIHSRWIVLPLAVLVAVYIVRAVMSKSLPPISMLLAVYGIGLPVVTYLISVLGPKPVFSSRQMIAMAFAAVALIGFCLTVMPRYLAIIFSTILIAWTVIAVPQGFNRNLVPPWREIASEIDKNYGTMVVAAQEEWVREPLAYYRKSGGVMLWDELAEQKKRGVYLFACRHVGSTCSSIESAAIMQHLIPLNTWRWGTHKSKYHQLDLYEIIDITRYDIVHEILPLMNQ